MPIDFKILTAPIVNDTKNIISNTVSNTVSKVSSNTGITFGSTPILKSPTISFSSKGISGLSNIGISSNTSLTGISSLTGIASGLSGKVSGLTSGFTGAAAGFTSGLTSGFTGAAAGFTSGLTSGLASKLNISAISSKLIPFPSMDMIGIALGAEKEQLLKIAQAKLVVPPWVPGLKINLGMIAGALKIIKEISSFNPSELLKQITDAIKEDIAEEVSNLKDSTGISDIQNQVKDAVGKITDAQNSINQVQTEFNNTISQAKQGISDTVNSGLGGITKSATSIGIEIENAKQKSADILNLTTVIPPKG